MSEVELCEVRRVAAYRLLGREVEFNEDNRHTGNLVAERYKTSR